MDQIGNERVLELEGLLQEVAFRLSPAQVEALIAHPDAVRSALAVAADVLSRNDGERPGVETTTGNEAMQVGAEGAAVRMAGQTGKGAPGTLLTSEELAKRIGVKTRQSVHEWLKKGRIVGWRGARRGHVLPAGQLDERGRPLDGLDRITWLFDDGYAAWVWLTTEASSLDGATPLTRLAEGEIDRVARAAEGDLLGDLA